MMTYEVREREITPVKVMSMRTIVLFSDISNTMGEMFDELYGYLTKAEAKFLPSAPFCLYHAENCEEDRLDIEVCQPVAELAPNWGKISGRIVDGERGMMISYTHKGPYAELGKVYPDMMRWMEDNGYEWDTAYPMHEIYLNDPFEVKPEEILTELTWAVRKK